METDIIIIGGGLVGGALAQGLALAGHKVVVVDSSPPPTHSTFDQRTLAIAAASRHLLDRLHIWENLSNNITPIERITLSDTSPESLVVFDMQDQSQPEPLGYMLQHGNLRNAIYTTATQSQNITWIGQTKPIDFRLVPGGIELTLEHHKAPLKAKILIGADGKKSWVRERSGIPSHRHSYTQTAVIALLKHPHVHRNVAVEHFTQEGPLAFLPMEGKTSGLVWSVSPSILSLLMESTEQAERLINTTFMDHRGPINLLTPLTTYPLEAVLPKRCISERICLVGDAAHSMHPVAGQGLNVGFRDIECLLEHLSQARYLGLDLGAFTLLEAYEKKRRFDHLSMLAATDSIVRIFNIGVKPIPMIRRFSLQALGFIPSIKKRMMRHAMGYS